MLVLGREIAGRVACRPFLDLGALPLILVLASGVACAPSATRPTLSSRPATQDTIARSMLVAGPLVPAEVATLPASGGISQDRLGWSVALSADGSRALVGAPYQTNTAGGKVDGAAYVFVRTGASWAKESALFWANAPNSRFGISVALSADGSRALVGAAYDQTNGGADAGTAHVFLRTGSTWTEEAVLLASNGVGGDEFGTSVALSADGTQAVVGAPYNDGAGENAGCAYTFVRSDTTWTQTAALVASEGGSPGGLGYSVGLSEDGYRVIAGAPWEDTAGGTSAGGARVYVRTSLGWFEEDALYASGGAQDDDFGFSVALSADGSEALVGAIGVSAAGTASGTAYAFARAGAAWSQEAQLQVAPGTASSQPQLGASVALSADGSLALAGARFDDTPDGSFAGSAHVFLRTDTTWTEAASLFASAAAADDQLGYSVALSADGSEALVGAPGATQPGRAHVFTLLPLRASGAVCTDAASCASGFCVDGVCCDSACGDNVADDCSACSVSAGGSSDGTCGPLYARACDDGNACTRDDVCQAGVCAGAPISCPASDECHVAGSCDVTTGVCGNPPAPNDTPCAGGACQLGTCTPPVGGPSDGGRSDAATGLGGAGDAAAAGGASGAGGATAGAGGAAGAASAAGTPGDTGNGGIGGTAGTSGGSGTSVAGSPGHDAGTDAASAPDGSADASRMGAGGTGCGCGVGGGTPSDAPVLIGIAIALTVRARGRR